MARKKRNAHSKQNVNHNADSIGARKRLDPTNANIYTLTFIEPKICIDPHGHNDGEYLAKLRRMIESDDDNLSTTSCIVSSSTTTTTTTAADSNAKQQHLEHSVDQQHQLYKNDVDNDKITKASLIDSDEEEFNPEPSDDENGNEEVSIRERLDKKFQMIQTKLYANITENGTAATATTTATATAAASTLYQSVFDDLDLDDLDDALTGPFDLDRLFQLISRSLQFRYEIEKVVHQNDYYKKYNVNIELQHRLSYDHLVKFIDRFFALIFSPICAQLRLICETPIDVINRLQKYIFEHRLLMRPLYAMNIEALSIGSLVNVGKFFSHYQVPMKRNGGIIDGIVEFRLVPKCIVLYFYLDTTVRIHRLTYNFSIIKTIIVEQRLDIGCIRLYFDCHQAPMLHFCDLNTQQQNELLPIDGNSTEQRVSDIVRLWQRTIKFQYMPRRLGDVSRPPQFARPTDKQLVGMAKTFTIDIPSSSSSCSTADILTKVIAISYVCRSRNKNFQLFFTQVQQVRSEVTFDDLQQLLTTRHQPSLPFSIHFASLVLFSASYKVLDAMMDEQVSPGKSALMLYIETLSDAITKANGDTEQLRALEYCIYNLKSEASNCTLISMAKEFGNLFSSRAQLVPEVITNDYAMIRRAILYPSHLELIHPVALLRSRFTNLANLDYALRVTVFDDNNRTLNKCRDGPEYDFVLKRIELQFADGIVIADRVYKFLGSSTSQMRDSGATLYATDDRGRNAGDIRQGAGNLIQYRRSVSKYVARFGLVFSQAMAIIELDDQVKISFTADYLGNEKPSCRNYTNFKKEKYILSDGVGIISRSVAKDYIMPHLDIKANYFPSAYQIRYGGCKGMLVVYNLSQPKIVFRESMRKYDSDSRLLGILKYSLPRAVFLNRPLISILDQLDVDRNELYRYFYNSTASVAKATLFNQCALELIRTYSLSVLPYGSLIQWGISLLDEPFLRSIINYLIYYRLNFELKQKARIKVPTETGRIAFGVIDETRTLEYGQVFFQYTKLADDGSMLTDEKVILQGEVMVTKFPCLQPGDVKKLTAVDVPKLRHIKDCLVFPAKGFRPHPDEMSGSDLDGDEYAIIFDRKLMFPSSNYHSMTFPYGQGKSQDYEVTENDIVKFFCHYLMVNNIGVVANQHLMVSDYHVDGLFSKECVDLAYTYCLSLDFPKTGYIEKFLKNNYHMNVRPDFMLHATNSEHVYLSRKMLGQYYRHCLLIEQMIELSQYDYRFSSFYNHSFAAQDEAAAAGGGGDAKSHQRQQQQQQQTQQPQPVEFKNRFILPGWKQYHDQANEAFLEYKMRVIDLIEQLEVENEVMLFADVYEDRKDVAKVLLNKLFDDFQRLFKQQCEKLKLTDSVKRPFLTSAWYAICLEKNFTYNGSPLLGLPWLIPDELRQLAQYSYSGKVQTSENVQHRKTVSYDGTVWNIHMEMNPNWVVPYCFDSALRFDILFDYEQRHIFNTDIMHYYWQPVLVTKFLLQQNAADGDDENAGEAADGPELLHLHNQLWQEIQIQLTTDLALQWMRRIKTEIYHDTVTDRLVELFKQPSSQFDEEEGEQMNSGQRFSNEEDGVKVEDGDEQKHQQQNQCKSKKIPEEILLRKIVLNIITKISKHAGTKYNEYTGGDSLITITTLFNLFLTHLFDICNQTNFAITNGLFQELFLLKYAVFALSFLNKLDIKLDYKFYATFSIDFFQSQRQNVALLRGIKQQQGGGGGGGDQLHQLPLQFSYATAYHMANMGKNVYEQSLDTLLDNYIQTNTMLFYEGSRFNLLPTPVKLYDSKVKYDIRKKVSFLSGIKDLKIFYHLDEYQLGLEKLLDNDEQFKATQRMISTASSSSNRKCYDRIQEILAYVRAQFRARDTNPNAWKAFQYQVHISGYAIANTCARILLGNPEFFSCIINKFEIHVPNEADIWQKEAAKEEEEEKKKTKQQQHQETVKHLANTATATATAITKKITMTDDVNDDDADDEDDEDNDEQYRSKVDKKMDDAATSTTALAAASTPTTPTSAAGSSPSSPSPSTSKRKKKLKRSTVDDDDIIDLVDADDGGCGDDTDYSFGNLADVY